MGVQLFKTASLSAKKSQNRHHIQIKREQSQNVSKALFLRSKGFESAQMSLEMYYH